LADQNALSTLEEANALLLAAEMPPLFERQVGELKLITRFSNLPLGHRTRRTNLPTALTSFVGRAQEIAEVRKLMNTTRLLTLTGAGGCGKTRLGQRVVADTLIAYPDGVWYVELAAISDPNLIIDTVARALGLATTEQSAQHRLINYLSTKQTLVLLDNCEQLIPAISEFAILLLRQCPQLSILTTSREALNVIGETIWRVPPMQVNEAGDLFVDRASAIRQDIALNPHDQSVTHICQRLDGMPLAIELAAARLGVLSLSEIAHRLDDRFNLLTHGLHGMLPRHQTLRAMIDWSYSTLTEPEKIVFRRLGIFVNGWELDQAEAVIGNKLFSQRLEPTEVLSVLAKLVNRSLIVVDNQNETTHYYFLETIRQYAMDCAKQAGEWDQLAEAHARFIAQWSIGIEQQLRTNAPPPVRRRIERQFPNIHSALTWSFGDKGERETGCLIIGTLQVFWYANTHSRDLGQWLIHAKDAMRYDMHPKAVAGVLVMQATGGFANNIDETVRLLREAIQYYEMAGDMAGVAYIKSQMGSILTDQNLNNEEGLRLLHEAKHQSNAAGAYLVNRCTHLSLIYCALMLRQLAAADKLSLNLIADCRQANDIANLSRALHQRGILYMDRLDFVGALELLQESAACAANGVDMMFEMFTKSQIAEIVRFMGNPAKAIELCETELAFAQTYMGMSQAFLPTFVMAKALNDLGQHDRALVKGIALLQDALNSYGLERTMLYNPLDTLASIASGSGNAAKSARLFGVSDGCLAAIKLRRWGHNDWDYAPYIAKARQKLGEAEYQRLNAEGYAMPLDQAIAYALSEA